MNKGNSTYSKVLVVDDERVFRYLMRKQLERFGFEIDLAEDGIGAVRSFENNNYCLIFMDIQMPYMNGLQATAAIRIHEEQMRMDSTPIIATTSGGATRELCLSIGMSDFIEKPVDLVELEMIIRKWHCGRECGEVAI